MNWVQKFKMECSSRKYFGFFGSMYFLGSMFGSLIFPRLSDIYGRKPFTIGCSFLHIMAGFTILLSNNLFVAYAMIFIQGMCMPARCIIGYVWLTESMILDQTTKSTSVMFTFDSFGILFCSIYFQYISKDWSYFYAAPLIFMLISTLALLFFDDSPKFYIGNK